MQFVNPRFYLLMLNNICPCFFWIKSQDEEKTVRHHNEYEEQQFMQHLQDEAKKSEKPRDHHELNSISIQDQLSHQLGLSQATDKNSQSLEQVQGLDQKAKEAKEQYSNKVQNAQLISTVNVPKFKLNIPQYSDYYGIIMEACNGMEDFLDTNKDCIQVNNSKLHINKTKLRTWKKLSNGEQAAFVIEYQLPCSYSFYSEMMNKNYSTKDNNKLIAEARLIESIFPNLCSKYLCFQKISLLDKRQMAYLKYTNGSENYHWQICISQDSLLQLLQKKFKLCKIHTVSLLIQQSTGQDSTGQDRKRLMVKTYIKIQAGITVDKIWQKINQQLRIYLQSLWQEASQNYQEQLV